MTSRLVVQCVVNLNRHTSVSALFLSRCRSVQVERRSFSLLQRQTQLLKNCVTSITNSNVVRSGHYRPINQRLEEEGVPSGLTADKLQTIILHAKSVWPAPSRIPPSWSSSWENWTYLLTFYWFSPHYLMIPQIDMIVNILYRLSGETRPLLFSNSLNQFIFTLFGDPARFFLYDMDKEILFEFEDVASQNDLIVKMEETPGKLPLRELARDPEGEDAIRRIMGRDETVIPILAEQFLDYTPEPTSPWQENSATSTLLSGDQKEILEKVVKALSEEKTEIRQEEQEEIMKRVMGELEREGTANEREREH